MDRCEHGFDLFIQPSSKCLLIKTNKKYVWIKPQWQGTHIETELHNAWTKNVFEKHIQFQTAIFISKWYLAHNTYLTNVADY